VLERFEAGGIVILRGAMLREIRAAGVVDRQVRDADDYAALLRDRFGLMIADAVTLWPRVQQQHQAWLARTATIAAPA
jgi:arylamine N-acetyltransferase